MATVSGEQMFNPQTDGPIQGLYKKVKTYLPEVEIHAIQRFDKRINGVMEGCDKVVATASTRIKNGVVDMKAMQKYANGLTSRVLNEIEDRLNTYIIRLEDEEAPSSNHIVIKKAEPETRLNRIIRKSRKLNQLVVRRITGEIGLLAFTAVTFDYPQLIMTLSNNLWLETRVITTVANDMISEWLEEQLRNLKVNFRRTKDSFIFNLKKCKDPQFVRDTIVKRATCVTDMTFHVIDECLSVKLNSQTLLKNWELFKTLVGEGMTSAKNKPLQLMNSVRGDSRRLYEKVVRNYRVQKILATRPKIQAAITEAVH